MSGMNHGTKKLTTLAALAALLVPHPGAAQTVDDTFLLTTSVAPNVVLIFDNSYRMNEIEWHPAFDPEASYACTVFDPNTEYVAGDTYVIDGSNVQLKNTVTLTASGCANSRKIFEAPASESPVTLYSGRYLNWYFSDAADPYITEIETAKASVVGCNQAGGGKKYMELYRRTRNMAARHVLVDVLCLAEPKNIRFGMAQFRSDATDPNGGYVAIEVARNQPTHAANMEAAIKTLKNDNWAPVSEAIFQLYTYLMPRTSVACPSGLSTPTYCRPLGDDGTTNFPLYSYDKGGDYETGPTMVVDPMDCDPTTSGSQPCPCQKNFIIMVTGGIGSHDNFDVSAPVDTANGFDPDFDALIGNYYADAETEEGVLPDEETRYLDDIAKYMQDQDLRPDLDDQQTVDLYTVGFGTTSSYDAYLQRAADLGNGLFFHAEDGEQLSTALVAALNDIVEKARSFTAATVPSSRTADGSDFYNSFFIPSGDHAFWEGHLRSWKFTATGEIHDSAGHCALDDPDGGSECNNGPFKKICQAGESWPACVVPYWDAGDATNAALVPGDHNTDTSGGTPRQLYTSKLDTLASPPVPDLTDLDQNLSAADMTIATFAAPPDPAPNDAQYPLKGSLALSEEGLADEVVAYARGCFFGTGALADVSTVIPCDARPWLVGDIFHSDPIVVRQPPQRALGSAYDTFRTAYLDRDRMIYTGTNGGFLEAFHAGVWDGTRYDEGTGVEKFGFMPWEPRKTIKKQIVDDPTARTHYVDGAPQVAEAWLYGTWTDTAQNAADWRTVLAGGLREGGRHYYALDVTNPSDDSGAPAGNLPYPELLWEFPNENDFNSGTGDYVNMGQTWGQPVLARVKLNASGNTVERWVAIVSGGYEETSDPNPYADAGTKLAVDTSKAAYDAASTKGRAIYMLDLKTGKVIAQQKMGYNGDADGTTTPETGLLYAIPSTPAVLDLDADGYADVVYVGDLGGNLWKWVIKPVGEDRANDGSSVRTQPNWKFHKFFEAPPTNISGDPWYYKNIFQPPAAAYADNKLWLAFGTGQRAAIGYLGDTGRDDENRYYVINDPDPLASSGTPAVVTEPSCGAGYSCAIQDVTSVTYDPSSYPRGYFFKTAEGEKFVTTSVIFAGKVISASFTPSQLEAGDPGFDPCTQRGSGNLYKFNLTTGVGDYRDASNNESRYTSLGTGLPTDPKISIGVGGDDNKIVIQKSGTELEILDTDSASFGRGIIYWRERK